MFTGTGLNKEVEHSMGAFCTGFLLPFFLPGSPVYEGWLLMTLTAGGAPPLGLGPSRHGLMLAAAGL